MSKPPSARSKQVTPPPFLVENVMILTAPVVSFLFVLSGWKANVEQGAVVTLSRKGAAGAADPQHVPYVPAHEARDAFAMIETIEDAVRFFERYGPLDNNSNDGRRYSLSQIRTKQETLKRYRKMDHRDFFGTKKDLRDWFESSPLQAELMVGQRPFWSVQAIDVNTAIRNATYIDHMRRVRVGTCRHCGKLFELPERRNQLYCDTPCQNKASKKRWNQKHGGKQNG